MARTKLGTTSTITESYVAIGTLILPDEPNNFTDVMLENTGDTDLKIASGTSNDSHSKTLAAGKSLFLAETNLSQLYVKTVDDGGSNILEFVGTPV